MKVWEVTPHPGTRKVDCYVEKDWGGMIRYVSEHLEFWLDLLDEEEMREGVSLTFRLVEMSEEEYQEALECD